MANKPESPRNADRENSLIIGRNAVAEALRSGRSIDCVYLAKGNPAGSVLALVSKAKSAGIPVKETDPRKLDSMCGHANHQGIIASAAVKDYAKLEDIFALAQARGEPPFIIIADSLNDPQNLGAIIRTAECAGAHGVIIPKHRSVGLTWAVGKVSAGAVEYVPVVRVNNLANTIDALKEKGVWVYAADMDGTPWCDVDFSGAAALVIGSEGEGISRLVKEKSDYVVSLPILGKINSLNASVACCVLCYEVARARIQKRKEGAT